MSHSMCFAKCLWSQPFMVHCQVEIVIIKHFFRPPCSVLFSYAPCTCSCKEGDVLSKRCIIHFWVLSAVTYLDWKSPYSVSVQIALIKLDHNVPLKITVELIKVLKIKPLLACWCALLNLCACFEVQKESSYCVSKSFPNTMAILNTLE